MIGKLMMGIGLAISLVGGVILAALATGTQMAQAGYQPSVQHYAEENASVGNPLAIGIIGFGVALLLVGLVLTLVRRVSR